MFTKLSSVYRYRTRSVTNENYYVEQVRTENIKRAFSISGALIWNGTPLFIKTLKKNQFKSELKEKLFEILEKEDDYIRVSDILQCNSQIITWFTSLLSTVCLPVSL